MILQKKKMELNEDILTIQKILIGADKSYGPFSKLTARGGNEKKILAIVDKLYKYFSTKNYINEGILNLQFENKLREIHWFLILNSDLSCIDELKENENLSHVVAIAPLISKCLLMDFIWGLNLEKFFYETLLYCPITLTVELLDPADTSMKFSNPYPQLERVRHIIEAIYSKAIRLEHEKIYNYTLESAITKLLGKTTNFLQFYVSPDSSFINEFKQAELYRYTGYAMYNIIMLMNYCLKLFLDRPDNSVPESCKIYDIKYDDGAARYYSSSSKTEKINSSLVRFNSLILSVCRANFMAVDVKIFCYWHGSKYYESEETLQSLISHLAYDVCEQLERVVSSDPLLIEVRSMLGTVARAPQTIDQKIKSADAEAVIQNVKVNGENQKQWFKALVKSDYLFSNGTAYECAMAHLNLCDKEDAVLLLNVCYNECVKSKSDNAKNLALSVIRVFDLDYKVKIVCKHFETKGLHNVFETDDVQAILTELFNKNVSTQTERILSILLDNTFLQNPECVLKFLFEKGYRNENYTELIVNIANRLKAVLHICDGKNNMVAVNILKDIFSQNDLSDKELDCLINFVKAIINENILQCDKIARDVVFPQIYSSMENKDFKSVDVLVRICCSFVGRKSFIELYIPFLIFTSEIIQRARWKLSNFSMWSVAVIQHCGKLVEFVLADQKKRKLLKDEDIVYLKNRLRLVAPANRFYYESLWTDGEVNFFQQVWPGTLADKTRTWNITRMTEVLPFFTTEEWQWIAKSMLKQLNDGLEVFNMYMDFLLMFTAIISRQSSNFAFSCLEFCVCNFGSVLKDIIYPSISDCYKAELAIWQGTLQYITKLPQPIKESCGLILVNVLLPILESLRRKNENIASVVIFDAVPLSDSEACKMICNKILEQ